MHMTAPQIREIVHRHFDAEARHDATAAAATYAKDGYYHHVPLDLRLEGRDAVAAGYAANFAAFPDSQTVDEGEVVEGHTYVHWGRFHATVSGSWLGLPPTHRRLDLPVVAVIEVRDGSMVGETLYYDLHTLCSQAGYSLDTVRAAAERIRAARAELHPVV
jgi:steroid delta-isomerase-like uncharacterized protein